MLAVEKNCLAKTLYWPQMTDYVGIQKIFSVPRTEPYVNEEFSIVTSIHHHFDSQALEQVHLVNDPGTFVDLCGTLYALHKCDLCDLCHPVTAIFVRKAWVQRSSSNGLQLLKIVKICQKWLKLSTR